VLFRSSRRTLGTDVQLAAEKLFAAIRLYAEVLRNVATHVQQQALGRKLKKREAQWQSGSIDYIGPDFGATWAGSPEEAEQANRIRQYEEAMHRRLWGED